MPALTPEENTALETGLTAAAAEGKTPEEAQAEQQEKKQVSWWLGQIKESRDFDKEFYKQVAVDRGYAQGLSAHEVSVNLIGSAIDVMKAFLYAKNPDVAITPAKKTSAPSVERPIMPIEPVNPMMQLQQMAGDAANDAEGVPAAGILASPEVMQASMALKADYDAKMMQFKMEMQVYQQQMVAYIKEMRARRQEAELAKRFAETLEILISKSWTLADLKEEARACVGGTLTTSIGWLKASWQEDLGMDPLSPKKLASLQENMQRIDALKLKMADKPTEELDRLKQQLTEEIAAVNAAMEVVTARGLIIDNIAAEEMTIPIGVTRVTKMASLPWLGHRVFMTLDEAKARFPDVAKWNTRVDGTPKEDCWASATRYSQRKPRARVVVPEEGHPGISITSESDASQFTTGGEKTSEMVSDGTGDFLCFHEIWDKQAGMVRYVCEGMPRYVRTPHAPEIGITRFFPFYNMAFVEADGQRWPQSLVQRSYGLQDEYNARRSSYKRQRARNKQGVLGNSAMLEKDEAGKITKSVDGEITFVSTVNDAALQNVFMAKPVVQLDPALYEVDSIRRDFEEMWGIEQARQAGLAGVEKTATQVDVEQAGFSAKTAFMREPEEAALQDLAVATAEILLQRLSIADAQEYAGRHAVWPEAASVADLASLVSVTIKAGSTGKPNLTSERNAWTQVYPLVVETIKEIGGLREAPPTETADKLQAALDVTLRLAGAGVSAAELVPQESMPVPQPQEGMPGAPADMSGMPQAPVEPPPAPTGQM
jgi:hypothetical protein